MRRTRNIQQALVLLALLAAVAAWAAPALQAQSPPGGPLFVEASVDNDRPYLGQQVTYVFKLFQRLDFSYAGQTRYEPPAFSGFWNSQATWQSEYTTAIGPDQYRVTELRTALFPSVVGAIAIEPARLRLLASSSGAPDLLESAPVALEVRQLPSAAPPGFTGAVGRFDISAGVDATAGRVNETVQLTVKLQGEGNIGALPHPAPAGFPDWRAVPSPPVSDSGIVGGRLAGSRTYGFALVPERAGELIIPAIGYVHFDPDLEEYVQAGTAPIVIAIADNAGVVPAGSASPAEAGDEAGSEMRPVKAAPPSLRQPGTELTGSPVYWAAWVIPLLAILGAAAWRRRRTAREAALAVSRRQNALSNAETGLERAVASGNDPVAASAEAVLSYLSDRLGAPVGGLTREALNRRLQDAGAPPGLASRVEETLAAGEAARFAPAASAEDGAGDHIERTTRLLTELEGAIQP